MRARQRLPLQILDDAKDSVVDIHIAGDRIFTASVDGYLRTYDLRAGQLRQDFLDCLYSLSVKKNLSLTDILRFGHLGHSNC